MNDWTAFANMMKPICMECLCLDERDDNDNPSNHDQYCPVYLYEYAKAMGDGSDVPE